MPYIDFPPWTTRFRDVLWVLKSIRGTCFLGDEALCWLRMICAYIAEGVHIKKVKIYTNR